MQGTFAALWGTHHLMHMLWGKLVVGMGPSIVSTSMGAAVAALNFGLNFAISQVVPSARHVLWSAGCSATLATACALSDLPSVFIFN